mgnify:CR=1 FL=1
MANGPSRQAYRARAHTRSMTRASLARCARLLHYAMVVHATLCSPCMCYAVLILIAKAFRLRHTKAVTWLARSHLACSLRRPNSLARRAPLGSSYKRSALAQLARYLVACSISYPRQILNEGLSFSFC